MPELARHLQHEFVRLASRGIYKATIVSRRKNPHD